MRIFAEELKDNSVCTALKIEKKKGSFKSHDCYSHNVMILDWFVHPLPYCGPFLWFKFVLIATIEAELLDRNVVL
jgi:hypothetical protein